MTDKEKRGAEENKPAITAIACSPKCIGGKDHQWDGPIVKLERGGSVSCSKCGMLAIEEAMWF
jgi:hypothetical protein